MLGPFPRVERDYATLGVWQSIGLRNKARSTSGLESEQSQGTDGPLGFVFHGAWASARRVSDKAETGT